MPTSQQSGQDGEDLALDYLQQQGLSLQGRNVRYPFGELDLIMWHESTLVFVEVRYRQSQRFGGALASVTAKKIRRLQAAAKAYLQRHWRSQPPTCRFDLEALSGSLTKPHILWLKNILQ